jgi:Cu-Zn family superoxide dismutase
MASSRIPIALFGVALSFASLFGATVAELVLPQAFVVASFDDKQSFIMSTDGQFLQGSLVIKQSITSSNKISIQLQSSGDIYSTGDLGTGTQLGSFSYGSCTASPCTVPFSNVPVPAGSSWCAFIGFGVTVSVDGVDSGIKAVFGFSQLPDNRCLFASAYNSQPASAIAKLLPVGSSGASGYVSFQLVDNSLVVSGRITNLAPSQNHGLHVHSYGDLRDTTTAMNTGAHLQPPAATTQQHALVSSSTRHTGDLGNILADSNGVASFSIVVPQDMAADVALTLLAKSGNAIGRAIVVHSFTDDGVTQPTGNSGGKVGQGVIGYILQPSARDVRGLIGGLVGFFVVWIINLIAIGFVTRRRGLNPRIYVSLAFFCCIFAWIFVARAKPQQQVVVENTMRQVA